MQVTTHGGECRAHRVRSPSRPVPGRSWPLLTLLALLGACEDEPPAPEAPEAPAPSQPTLPEAPAPSPWPTEVRPLEASVADFESLETCVASMRESVPVEVAELFHDLGYVDALGEVCRSLQAAATGDAAHCDALVSSTVRRRCRTRLAALHGEPAACPDASGDAGRDPTCLAWATRDASLCDGASAADRSTCLAVATGEPERCEDPLGLYSAASCRAVVARLDGVVDADPPPARPAPELVIEESNPPVALPDRAARALERGVFASAAGCAHQVELTAQPTVADGRDRVGLTLVLVLAEGAELGSASEIAIGPVGTGYALTGEVVLEEGAEPTPGGPLQATVRATYTRDGRERTLTLRLRTFFRDVTPLPDRCRAE